MPKYRAMPFLILLFSVAPVLCHADPVTDCLRGNNKTASCHKMIVNYWRHNSVIEQVARQEGLEPELLKALIAYESAYNHRAVSPVRASGLTQVMPTTALGMRVHPSRLFIPEVSVRTGARYLRQMYNKFGRLDLALAAYNAGPRRVIRAGNRIPKIAETQIYVRNITALYLEFKRKASTSHNRTSYPHPSATHRRKEAENTHIGQTGNSAYQSHTSNMP